MKAVLGDEVAEYSLWSGGATALTITSIPNDHIQVRGHWPSDAYQIYIRQHLHQTNPRFT